MTLYSRFLFPRLANWLMGHRILSEQRALVLREARCTVLEIGAGSGLNFGFYPGAVGPLLALDRNPGMVALASSRRTGSGLLPALMIGDGQRLPLVHDSVDTVVMTWTLCSVDDPGAVLGEARRVLRPGGRLLFVEHGLHPSPKVARWQHRLNPLQRRLGDGCRLDRDVTALMAAGGFRLEKLETFQMEHSPRWLGYTYRGVAAPRSDGRAGT